MLQIYLSRAHKNTHGHQSPGTPLAVKTPETYYIHFSSDHIQELKDAPDSELSLHALSNDVRPLQFALFVLEREQGQK